MEERLRKAQCADALDAVRRILRLKSRMVQFKNKNLRGQKDGTRSRAMIDRVHEKARASAEKYRAARAALLKLAGPGPWEETFRILADADIRGFQDANKLRPRKGWRGVLEDDQVVQEEEMQDVQGGFQLLEEERSRQDGTGETRRTLSWIWTTVSGPPSTNTAVAPSASNASSTPSTASTSSTPATHSTNPNEFPLPDWPNGPRTSKKGPRTAEEKEKDRKWMERDRADDVLRGEWAKSRARAKRATEEVLLLKEEMSRVLRYLEWKGSWWAQVANERTDGGADLTEGIRAVAIKNSSLQQALAAAFRERWKSPLDEPAPSMDLISNNQSNVENAEQGSDEDEDCGGEGDDVGADDDGDDSEGDDEDHY